jgi:N-acetylmuramoyl-L-alanine amidase
VIRNVVKKLWASYRRPLLLASLSLSFILLLWLTFQQELWQEAWYSLSNTLGGTVHVGLQIGHLDVAGHPDELEALRYNTGGFSEDRRELEVNKAVAYMLRDMLESEGIEVDILPATVPIKYRADVFIALHADSSTDRERRGYKSAFFRKLRNKQDPILKEHLDQTYFYFSGLSDDDANVSGSMLEYYAFNHQRFNHSVARKTPAIIVELGYISNDSDWDFLKDPVKPAYALKMGILSYLREVGRLKERSGE